jgi:hypothetical protein
MRVLCLIPFLVLGSGCARLAAPSKSDGGRSFLIRIDLAAGRPILLTSWKLRNGDGIDGADPTLDDSSWTPVGLADFRQATRGVHWYRTSLILQGESAETEIPAVKVINLPRAAELYWDGRRLGANGQVGRSRAEERSGLVVWTVRIPPPDARVGIHVLALRTSNWGGRARSPMFGISWGNVSVLEAADRSSTDRQLLYMGIFLTAGLFCLALYIGGGRHRSYLVFFFYTLMQFLSTAAAYAVDSAGLTFPLYHVLIPIDMGWPFVEGLFLNLFFLFHFDIPRKALHVAAMAAALAVLSLSGVQAVAGNLLNNLAMSLYGAGLLFFALRRKKPGSASAFSGLLLLLAVEAYAAVVVLASLRDWPSPKFLFSLGQGGFLAFIILAISMTIRAQNRRFEALRLRSQRLENELLKNSIQPHFIMNTLHSIKSWCKSDPEQADHLIEALAEEFRIVNDISTEREIPLEEEIRLCRYHLQLMGLRRAAHYELLVEGETEGVLIPPLIIHTLVENGLTHAYEPGQNGVFRLDVRQSGSRLEFRLTNDGSPATGPEEGAEDSAKEGLGMKYVKARLEECWPGRWSLAAGRSDGLWDVRIAISIE